MIPHSSSSFLFHRRAQSGAGVRRLHLAGEHLRGRGRLLRLQDRRTAAAKKDRVEVQRKSSISICF